MLGGALGHAEEDPDAHQHAQGARHVEDGRPPRRAARQRARRGQAHHDAEGLGREEEGHHPGALPGRRPLAEQLVARRQQEALRQALAHARRARARPVAVDGAHRHEQVEDAGHDDGHGEEALGAEALRQLAGGDVHHHVPPEEGRQHQAGARRVPVEGRHVHVRRLLGHGDDGHGHVGPGAEGDGRAEEHDERLDVARAHELAGPLHVACSGVGATAEPVERAGVLLGGGDHDGGGVRQRLVRVVC